MDRHQLYYEVAFRTAEDDNRTYRDFQTKAASLLGIAAALVGVAMIILKDFSGGTSSPISLSGIEIGMVVAVSLTFIAVGVISIYVLWPKTWHSDPHIENYSTHVKDTGYEDDVLVDWTADQYRNAVQKNRDRLGRTATMIAIGYSSLGLQVLSVIGLAIAVGLSL